MLPQFVGILIGSAVIGYHWLNHQRCCSKLARVDRRCMILNLMHPGLLPRMPASRHAHQHRILRAPVPRRVSRRGLLAGLPSVAHVLANVSVARWNPDYAKSAWLLVWPAGWAISRAAPSGTSRYLE
jgi:hypothetical protein